MSQLEETAGPLSDGDFAIPSPLALPLLITILTTALLTGLILFIRLLDPRPAWRFLLPIVFLSALEGIYTTRWLLHPDRRQLNRPLYRLAELLVMALILRLLAWAVSGGLPDWETWRGYLLNPLTFLDATYFGYLVCALFAWARGSHQASLFSRLYLSHAERAYYTLSPEQQRQRYDDRPISRERPQVFEQLVRSWLGGAGLLAIFAMLTTVDLPTLSASRLRTITRLGLQPEMLSALLVYFLLGLALISHARLIMMQSRWKADGVRHNPAMVQTWRRATVVLLLAVALIAAFLPIGSTFAIASVLEAIANLALLIFQLFFLLFGFLFFLLTSLLGIGSAPEEAPLEAGPPITPPAPLLPPGPASETAALIMGTVFWIIVVVVVTFAVVFFLRDRGYSLRSPLLHGWWQNVLSWLRGLLRTASAGAGALQKAVQSRLRRVPIEEGGPQGRWRFIRVNALSPRDQIRYFYLSTVRRAGDQGVPRAQSETPLEYARDLKAEWPEADEEIAQLTDAFLEARYNRRPIERDDVNPVKRVWKEVRGTLRRRA